MICCRQKFDPFQWGCRFHKRFLCCWSFVTRGSAFSHSVFLLQSMVKNRHFDSKSSPGWVCHHRLVTNQVLEFEWHVYKRVMRVTCVQQSDVSDMWTADRSCREAEQPTSHTKLLNQCTRPSPTAQLLALYNHNMTHGCQGAKRCTRSASAARAGLITCSFPTQCIARYTEGLY